MSEDNNSIIDTNTDPYVKEENTPAIRQVKDVFSKLFDLNRDKENTRRTIESLKLDVDLWGTKLWVLVCAVLIASLGLNINSNPVIIGAMLISPLMGPIIGFGLGMGIYDFELIKRSLRNLGLTALFSVITAALYFLITPLSDAQSELLARTNPTIFDVGIAFVGGIAGILASSSKSKGNVIPGVAIATALMPPLCTAGYGLATWNFKFFAGAMYLFIINSVFIALATYIFVKAMKFPRKEFVDKAKEKRIHRLVIAIVLIIIVPSIYFGYKIVEDSYVKDATHKFIAEHFDTDAHPVVKQSIEEYDGKYRAEVILMGSRLDSTQIDSITRLRSKAMKNVFFVIKQNLKGGDTKDLSVGSIKTLVMQDFYENSQKIISAQQKEIDHLDSIISLYDKEKELNKEVSTELKVLYPFIESATILPIELDSEGNKVIKVLINSTKKVGRKDETQLINWTKCKTNSDSIDVIFNYIKPIKKK